MFIDDRRERQAKNIGGLRVYSPSSIDEAVLRHDAAQIVVAIPSASAAQKRALIDRVEATGLPVKILPGLVEMVDGNPAVADIRQVESWPTCWAATRSRPTPASSPATSRARWCWSPAPGVPSAANSAARSSRSGQSALVLIDHSEFALYTIEHDLLAGLHGVPMVTCLGSVLDASLLVDLMKREGVQTIYHAAAYKHVPIVEANPSQGCATTPSARWRWPAWRSEPASKASCSSPPTRPCARPT